MARTLTTTHPRRRGRKLEKEPVAPFNQRMLDARLAAGFTGTEKALVEAMQRLPHPDRVSASYIARLEHNMAEEAASTVVVAALAKTYGVPLKELSEHHAERADRHRDLLDPTSPWNSDALRVTV
jgi:transcriptional regulator with XRE-family HTH domain